MRDVIGRWWQELNQREQRLVLLACALGGIMAAWLFLYRPLSEFREDARRDHAAALARLEVMREGAAEAGRLQTSAAPRDSDGTVRGIATSTAQARGIKLSQLQPGADGKVALWIEEVDARKFQEWLVALREKHGIAVTKISLAANEETPTVRVQMELSRPMPGDA